MGTLLWFLDKIIKFYKDLMQHVKILNAKEIARRMFVTNSFDGLLSSLGVILGNYIYGTENPENYVAGVIGASFALGFFSGIVATYLSERAERLRELRQTERAVMHPLSGSIYEKAAKTVPLYVALWSGMGAIFLPIIGLLPFILSILFSLTIPITVLVYSSAAIILAELFLLGAYLGKISGENSLLSGLQMTLIGLAAVVVFTIVNIIT